MNNNAVFVRIQLAKRFLQEAFAGTLKKAIDKIPVEMVPKRSSSFRCCVYKDRAILRYRLMALLGGSVEAEEDETRRLAEYVDDAETRGGAPEGQVLTLIDTACHSCPSGRHTVTNLCRGCLAQKCFAVCPRDAVSFVDGKAVIDNEKCVNCGKCKEACPYNAVVYTPVPCEQACPVGAIKKTPQGYAAIDYDKCISCGQCSMSCPFGAVMERSHLYNIATEMKRPDEEKPVALVAPAAAGQFPGSFRQLTTALKKAGFAAVVEVAYGAITTVAEESQELKEHLEKGKPLATSCCPAYTEAVRIHVQEFQPFVSTAQTPMAATAAYAKNEWPDRKTVFIGPCIAKRVEARRDKSADYVMTFEELASMFLALDIDVAECGETAPDNPVVEAPERFFARSGGVTAAVLRTFAEEKGIDPEIMQVDGLDKKAMTKMKLAATGKIKMDFAEVMCCPGGCICGPGTVANPRISGKRLEEYANSDSVREAEEKAEAEKAG